MSLITARLQLTFRVKIVLLPRERDVSPHNNFSASLPIVSCVMCGEENSATKVIVVIILKVLAVRLKTEQIDENESGITNEPWMRTPLWDFKG